jgi:hypothetical protein
MGTDARPVLGLPISLKVKLFFRAKKLNKPFMIYKYRNSKKKCDDK